MVSLRLKAVGVVGLMAMVVIGLLWLGFSASGGEKDEGLKPAPEAPWNGTMATSTENVQVMYDGKATRCLANSVVTPGHFVVYVTNYADQSLVCSMSVVEAPIAGAKAGASSWLKLPPLPTVSAQKTGRIGVRVELPEGVPDGQYSLRLMITKNAQVVEVPVYFSVSKGDK